jgi:hypothetical protein
MIYGGFGGFEVTRGSRLHFDKTQNVLVPSDQIKFAAMIGRAVVAGDNRVAPPAQVEISVFFAMPASTLVRRRVLR